MNDEKKKLMKKTVSKKTIIIIGIVGVLICIPCAILGFQLGRDLGAFIHNIMH